jgi:hypothetical protein
MEPSDHGQLLEELLKLNLMQNLQIINQFSAIFEFGIAEYGLKWTVGISIICYPIYQG